MTKEKPKSIELAEKLNEHWRKVRHEDITDYINGDGTLKSPAEADKAVTEFNGHAYALASDCVNSVRRAKEDPNEIANEVASGLLAEEFRHVALEIRAAAKGVSGGARAFDDGALRAQS